MRIHIHSGLVTITETLVYLSHQRHTITQRLTLEYLVLELKIQKNLCFFPLHSVESLFILWPGFNNSNAFVCFFVSLNQTRNASSLKNSKWVHDRTRLLLFVFLKLFVPLSQYLTPLWCFSFALMTLVEPSVTREVSSCPWISTVLGLPKTVEFLVEHC